MGEVIKAYKGFNKDMTCKPAGIVFQYEEGKEYQTEKVNVCHEGFHACEYPLDVFRYYAPASSVFHEVELSGKVDRDGDGSKVASSKIKIGASINIAGLVKAAIEHTNARVEKKKTKHNTGDYGASSNTGYRGASSNTGYRGSSEAGHANSIAVAWGPESKAKGVKGAYLVFAEWKDKGGYHWEEKNWDFSGAQMVRVDGEIIKEDTWYWLKDGKVCEWKEY